jgi:hypothetical protein
MEYDRALVLILNEIVPPWFTLMSVAKPWILVSPIPEIDHWLGSFPGLEFSQTMSFTTGGLQPNVWAWVGPAKIRQSVAREPTKMALQGRLDGTRRKRGKNGQ